MLIQCWLIANWIFPFLSLELLHFYEICLNTFLHCFRFFLFFGFVFLNRVQNRLLLSAAVSMTWIPPSVCPLRPARTRPSHLLRLPDSSPMQTSSAKSSVNLWRQNEHTSKSVPLILFVGSRWSLSVHVFLLSINLHFSLPWVALALCITYSTGPIHIYLRVPGDTRGDTAVPLTGYYLIFFCPV